jgi:hypothetical protein
VTTEERERIRAAARRYVHEQAPTPPDAVLERVARIVLETKRLNRTGAPTDQTTLTCRQPGAA